MIYLQKIIKHKKVIGDKNEVKKEKILIYEFMNL